MEQIVKKVELLLQTIEGELLLKKHGYLQVLESYINRLIEVQNEIQIKIRSMKNSIRNYVQIHQLEAVKKIIERLLDFILLCDSRFEDEDFFCKFFVIYDDRYRLEPFLDFLSVFKSRSPILN